MADVKPILEKYLETGDLPLIIKINARIYPKRFKNNIKMNWYPALCDRDCADMLVKYYRKERFNAKDDEPFFVTNTNKKLRIQRVSLQIRYIIDKIYRKVTSRMFIESFLWDIHLVFEDIILIGIQLKKKL